MKRESLNKYLNKNVEVIFTDGDVVRGKLQYTAEFGAASGWRRPDYYAIGNLDFKASHVKKVREVMA